MSYRVGCLNGSRMGVDHANAVTVIGEAESNHFNIGLTKFMSWYWRLKEMRVLATVEWRTDIGTPVVNTFDFLITRGGEGNEIEDEYKLVEDISLLTGIASEDEITMTIPGPPGSGSCTLNLDSSYNSDSKLFGIGTLGLLLNVGGVATVVLGPIGSFLGTVVVDGESLDLYQGAPFTGAIIDSAEVVVTPTKFYPYLTKTGLPVYHEDSGAVLNSPFS
jgi:hypothetical protein